MWRSIIEVILTIEVATFVIVLSYYSILVIWILCISICGMALMASLSDWYYSNDDKIVDDVDVVIVKVVKSRHERTHEVVDLSSESDGEEEIMRKTRRRSKKLNL